ncbi:MAG: archaeosortase/exosortase family protein [Acidobacteria bacterium]|nr:archaeosortase/exosortase family protein [Acidobacteriota bacterium]
MAATISETDKSRSSFAGDLISGPVAVLLLQMAAFWSAWRSMAYRVSFTGEPVWELLPLVSVVFLAWFAGKGTSSSLTTASLLFASAFAILYAASFAFAPPLARAAFALVSVAFILSRWRFGRLIHIGVLILLLLSLPVADSLNFYLGFPMRVVVGEAVSILLRMQGLDVLREGVILHFGQQAVSIDAPCSGVKMLWFGMFLAMALSTFVRLGNLRIVAAMAAAFAAIMLGNVFRAASLFYLEAKLIEGPEWLHSAVGVIVFALTSLAIIWIVKKLAGQQWKK